MQLFSADPKIFSKQFLINFLSIKTLKNWPQKLLIISPDPFISQSSPDHSPQPRIDFSYHEISGPDICFLICDLHMYLNFYSFLVSAYANERIPSDGELKLLYLAIRILSKYIIQKFENLEKQPITTYQITVTLEI
jgi:hypothetical protein